jgi:hypothetical protein
MKEAMDEILFKQLSSKNKVLIVQNLTRPENTLKWYYLNTKIDF